MAKERRKFSSFSQNEAPGFNTSTPRNPVDGQFADLARKGLLPYCAMLQVAAEDTHDNYLICRGFNTRDRRFYDYVEGDADKKGIAVAKPYGVRGLSIYTIGEIYAAFLPVYQFTERTEYNQNPGKADTTVGHPADLDEDIVFLKTDEDIHINWMILEVPATKLVEMCLAEDHTGRHTVFDVYKGVWSSSSNKWLYPDVETTYKATDARYGVPYPDAGAKGLFTPRLSDTHGVVFDCVSLDCTSPGDCDD